MAVRFCIVSIILLSLSVSCLSDPVQDPEVVFKRTTGEDGDVEETTTKTQIDQLYQIYQATQNNIIQLNTEMSLLNEQLTSLREMVKTQNDETSSNVEKLISDVENLTANQKQLQEETKANISQLTETVNTNFDRISSQFSDVYYAVEVMNNDTRATVQNFQSSVDSFRETTETKLSSLQSSVTTLDTTTTAQLNSLQSSVDTLNTDRDTAMAQLDSLQSTVNSLNTVQHTVTTQVNSLQSTVDTIDTAQLNNLQSTVDTLINRVNSPVNLYQNCIQETRSCEVSASSTERYYYSSCDTRPLPMNVTGYYTLEMRCQYDRKTGHYDAADLRSTSTGQYQCNCVSTAINHVSGPMAISFPAITCTLVATRCPLSKRLY